jgi:ABC-type transport system involved in cytochrome c biogenesis ATPase subunit
MIADLSDAENIGLLRQMGASEIEARMIVAIERGEIEGDVESTEGRMTAATKRRVGLGRLIFEPLPGERHPMEDE